MKRFLFLLLLSALTHISLSQTCMFYFIPKSMDWSDAQTHCRQNYIDLATMDDQTDQDEMMRVIRQVYNGDVWIGLSDGVFVWSDQSSSSFTRWKPGQPQNQLCVNVEGGYWFDRNCEDNVAFACYFGEQEETDRESGGEIESKSE
uniref:C-type lectin domain-containing protein n=1 Tax=Sinocyclocheilus rhinocerous TaxID=307959 RepID=A0A673HE22_9TELE